MYKTGVPFVYKVVDLSEGPQFVVFGIVFVHFLPVQVKSIIEKITLSAVAVDTHQGM
jgi:hypothetical protein